MIKKTVSVAISHKAYAMLKDKAHHDRRSVNIWLDYYLEKTFPVAWSELDDPVKVRDPKLDTLLNTWGED
jgi:hypothetical protein